MATHTFLRASFAFLFGVLLLVSRLAASPLDARAFPIATDAPTTQLDKRDGVLVTLYNRVVDKNKVNTATARSWELYPDKGSDAAVYAPTEFYGCMLVVIVNGRGVIIGHFAEVEAGAGSCTVMNDPKAVQSDIIDELETAEAMVDVDYREDTRAWIVYSDDILTSSPGYKAIMDNLQTQMVVPQANIVSVPYRRGGGGGNSDKLAVQWTPKPDGSGATMNVYIRSDTPQFTGNYNRNGDPVANSKHRRAATACTPKGQTQSTITSAPSCTYVAPEPPIINEAFCSCSGSSYALTSIPGTPVAESASCAYKTLPGTQVSGLNGDPVTTNSALCQVCTPYAANGADCTTIPNCQPQKAQVTVQAGSSPVHVGTLTSTALYTSISSALASICPPVTQTTSMTACSTDSVKIGGIPWVEAGVLNKGGELIVKVESSAYNVTSLRDAMINSAALTAQHSSQQEKNCYTASYETGPGKRKRDYIPFWTPARRWFGLAERDSTGILDSHGSDTWCNIASFAGVQYYDRYWRLAPEPGSTDYIDASWSFGTGPGGNFACEFIQGLIDALGVIAPEFAVEDIELGEAIGVACTAAMDHAGK